MSVFLPTLIRPGMHPEIRQRHTLAVETLDLPWPPHHLIDPTPWPPAYDGENYWGRFARMRQAAVENLPEDVEWVLWIDSDIVEIPIDLFKWFRTISEKMRALVSPFVRIEYTDHNADTAGTRPSWETRSPWTCPTPGVYRMFSLGACVLVPAEVHRKVRFEAQADTDTTANTEWTSLCRGAVALGYELLWDTSIEVVHANLPEYGLTWPKVEGLTV